MSQERQAEEAAKILGPGRHICVELKDDYNEVSWPRVSRTTQQAPKALHPVGTALQDSLSSQNMQKACRSVPGTPDASDLHPACSS